jgi:Domain of unknown function (DUF4129)
VRSRHTLSAGRRLLWTLLLVLLWASVSAAIPLSEYHDHVKKAINSLDLLDQSEEGLTESQLSEFESTEISAAHLALPATETVEWRGTSYVTDNTWLTDDLKEFESRPRSDTNRAHLLQRILERLQALEERLAEISRAEATSTVSKEEMQGRLTAILQRSEYAGEAKGETSALGRLLKQIVKWLESLFPEPRPGNERRAMTISRVSQILVVALALAVIAYAIRLAAPHLFRKRAPKKKKKVGARIVLGERLEPDQSGADLLAEAEALARAGDVRGAIRKGYIALLVELGDRKVISLAHYKTNRDYLRSVREIEKLHGNMQKLTSSFEEHWYGLAQAHENDWTAFRAFYREALRG